MKEAIQKAIEGGWDKKRALFNPNDASYSMEKMYCDPLFWQCLGKALGWSGKVDMKFINAFGNTLIIEQIQRWEMNQHKFIHHLAEGKDVEEFFNWLIK